VSVVEKLQVGFPNITNIYTAKWYLGSSGSGGPGG